MAKAANPLTFETFCASLADAAPPAGLGKALQALWHEAHGGGPGATRAASDGGEMAADWHSAHRLAQRERDQAGHWVHAYLHRLEGDADNAGYWYGRAGKPFPNESFAEEWEAIVRDLLAR